MSHMDKYDLPCRDTAGFSPQRFILICRKLDTRLSRYASDCNLTFSRYADDIMFSGDFINGRMMRGIENIISNEGFEINKDKSRVLGRGSRQIVCGLVVNQGVGFGRKRYQNLKAEIHNCKLLGVHSQHMGKNIRFKEHLLGKIAALKHPDFKKWQKLKKQIESLDWGNRQIGNKIIDLISNINITAGTKIFGYRKNDLEAIYEECYSSDQLRARTLQLFQFINKIDVKYFNPKYLELPKDKRGSVKIIKNYLEEKSDNSRIEKIIPNWIDIKILADHLLRHSSDETDIAISEVFTKYQLDMNNPNYEDLRYKLLKGFQISLENLIAVIISQQMPNKN